MPRRTFGDVVVLLPGLTGSVLRRDGKDLWGPSAGSLLGAALSRGGRLGPLVLREDPVDRDDLGRRGRRHPALPRRAPDPRAVEDRRVLEAVGRRCAARWGSCPGENYFECPYDWRRDVRVARPPPGPPGPRVAGPLAPSLGQRRGPPGAGGPLDGRARGPGLPGASRRLADHAGARRLRDALPGLAERPGRAVQRLTEGPLGPRRPHRTSLAPAPRCTSSCRSTRSSTPAVGRLARVTEVTLPNLDPERGGAGPGLPRGDPPGRRVPPPLVALPRATAARSSRWWASDRPRPSRRDWSTTASSSSRPGGARTTPATAPSPARRPRPSRRDTRAGRCTRGPATPRSRPRPRPSPTWSASSAASTSTSTPTGPPRPARRPHRPGRRRRVLAERARSPDPRPGESRGRPAHALSVRPARGGPPSPAPTLRRGPDGAFAAELAPCAPAPTASPSPAAPPSNPPRTSSSS